MQQEYSAILNWCAKTYGSRSNLALPSIYEDCSLENNSAVYDFDSNIIYIGFPLTNLDLVKIIIHEYQHYLKHSVTEFEALYNKGFNYVEHPLEIEAETIAKNDCFKCYNVVNLGKE